jgi:hypothetical protein
MMEPRMKRMTIRHVLFFLLAGCASLFLPRCEIDHGLQPIHSKIGGHIRFTGDRVPRDTDEIRVAVIKDFPPRNLKELLFSDMIPFAAHDTVLIDTPVPWEIFVPPGEYDMVAVIWKENGESWNISDVVGVYGGFFLGDMLFPTYKAVLVPSADSEPDTIDIHANVNRVNRDAKISGTITFQGDWPRNTGIVGVGAFVDIPRKGDLIDYYLKNAALDYGVKAFVTEYGYQLRVRSADVLKYVAVIWIDASYDLTSIREIGFYADSKDSSKPGTVQAPYGKTAENINITVDFSKF